MRKPAKSRIVLSVTLLAVSVISTGCATTTHRAFEAEQSVELRSVQTRAFDTTDRKEMMQTIASTMQDLDFVIDRADYTLGSITGTKFYRNSVIKMSVTVRGRGEKQLLVRVNAQHGVNVIKDAETYQDFFNTLGKAMFLTAHKVD